MSPHLLGTLNFAAAIAAGLVAGVFFGFSNFIMAALGRIAPAEGAAAMNAINITVINPAFMILLFGAGLLGLVLAAMSFGLIATLDGKLMLAAGLVYVLGCIGVTMVCNVPLNDALAAVTPGTPEALSLWTRYLGEWTFWNHVRMAASLAAAILFAWAGILSIAR